MKLQYDVIKFSNDGPEIDVKVSPLDETIWISIDQMALLFGRDKSVISRHIKNIFLSGELSENGCVAFFATELNKYDPRTQKMRTTIVDIKQFNLDVVISVGYRVKSKNGVIFRTWASNILRDYILKGYAANERRLTALNKTIELQSRIIASAYDIEARDVLNVVESYVDALTLLDNYDHQCIPPIKKDENYVRLTYKDVRTIVESMEYYGKSDVFGVEKEKGKVEGILAAVYQNVFGEEVYPSIKEKAAHLLYFMVKDHPFADGCKRIAAASFLTFLAKNKALRPNLSSPVLVAITLLTAESNPKDFKSIIQVIANII